jgi:hypothetical protein
MADELEPGTIVGMYHPETGNNGTTTVEGFQKVWQQRGWELQGGAAHFASQVLDKPVGRIETLNMDELKQVALYLTFDEVPGAKKEAWVSAIKKATGDTGDTPVVIQTAAEVEAETEPESAPAEAPAKVKRS